MDNLIVYLQVDLRFDKYSLKKVGNDTVINHTIKNILKLKNLKKVIFNLYDCSENRKIIVNYSNKVEINYSDEENLTLRMLNSISKYKNSYVLIISPDQMFLDIDKVDEVVNKLYEQNLDGYYSNFIDGRLCNIFKVPFLINLGDKLQEYDRYYKYIYLNKNNFRNVIFNYSEIKQYYSYYIKNDIDYNVTKAIYHNITEYSKDEMVNKVNLKINKILHDLYKYKNNWINSIYNSENIEKLDILPWITYSAIEFIKPKITSNLNVFEYGSGLSTLWWAKKVKKIISIENNLEWYKKSRKLTQDYLNVEIKYIKLGNEDYNNEICNYYNEFDIIVIDGRERVKCASNCLRALKDGGIIIWDDTDRKKYSEGYNFLFDNGFKEIGFMGVKPGVVQNSKTSVFYRDKNIFNI